jgi:hypothetical protein
MIIFHKLSRAQYIQSVLSFAGKVEKHECVKSQLNSDRCFNHVRNVTFARTRKRRFKRSSWLYKDFLPSVRPNWDLGDLVKEGFQEVACICELILFLLGDVKCGFGEILKAKFQMRTHFLLPGQPKMWLRYGRKSDVSIGRLFLRTHFLPPVRPKMRLRYGRESDVSRGLVVLWKHFLFLAGKKHDLVEIHKPMFQ